MNSHSLFHQNRLISHHQQIMKVFALEDLFTVGLAQLFTRKYYLGVAPYEKCLKKSSYILMVHWIRRMDTISSATCFNFTINWTSRPVEHWCAVWRSYTVSNFIYKLYLDVASGVYILIARVPLCVCVCVLRSCHVGHCNFWLSHSSFQVS